MKTLCIGHYKEGSGWSQATTNLILTLDHCGIDTVCRNIKLNNSSPPIKNRILELERKDLNNLDYCIQNVLPHHIIGTGKFKKNIACFVGESNTLKYSSWLPYLKLVDEVWVPNKNLELNLKNDGLKNVKFVPYSFDISKFYDNNSNMRINFQELNDTFKFYYIGDLNDRKNLYSIIRCFHSEFESYEPVSLILKINKFGVHPNDLAKYVNNMCSQVKKELKLYSNENRYKKELVITEPMTDNQIDVLHRSCDCYISPSYGEGWSIPSFEAMCYGNTPICSKEGGPEIFIDENNKSTGTLINGVYNICNHRDPAFPDIFTGREEWFIPSEREIKKAMRFYYENRNKPKYKTEGLRRADNFSFENVGNIIKEYLHE